MSVNKSSDLPLVNSLWLVVMGGDSDSRKTQKRSNVSRQPRKKVISCPVVDVCERDKRFCLRFAVCGHEGAIRID